MIEYIIPITTFIIGFLLSTILKPFLIKSSEIKAVSKNLNDIKNQTKEIENVKIEIQQSLEKFKIRNTELQKIKVQVALDFALLWQRVIDKDYDNFEKFIKKEYPIIAYKIFYYFSSDSIKMFNGFNRFTKQELNKTSDKLSLMKKFGEMHIQLRSEITDDVDLLKPDDLLNIVLRDWEQEKQKLLKGIIND